MHTLPPVNTSDVFQMRGSKMQNYSIVAFDDVVSMAPQLRTIILPSIGSPEKAIHKCRLTSILGHVDSRENVCIYTFSVEKRRKSRLKTRQKAKAQVPYN